MSAAQWDINRRKATARPNSSDVTSTSNLGHNELLVVNLLVVTKKWSSANDAKIAVVLVYLADWRSSRASESFLIVSAARGKPTDDTADPAALASLRTWAARFIACPRQRPLRLCRDTVATSGSARRAARQTRKPRTVRGEPHRKPVARKRGTRCGNADSKCKS